MIAPRHPQLAQVLVDAQRIGLLGPEPIARHVAHACAWAEALEPATFLDLGSGAGVPGLIGERAGIDPLYLQRIDG